jgi:hypothetical protein
MTNEPKKRHPTQQAPENKGAPTIPEPAPDPGSPQKPGKYPNSLALSLDSRGIIGMKRTPMTPEKNAPAVNPLESPARRDLFQKFGKLAAYAAPFTVLAFSQKASAATGTGPVKHFKPRS